MPNLVSLALHVMKICRGSQNLKSRSRDLGHAPFDPILYFCLGHFRVILHAKFEICSFVRYGDMEGVPKFKK